MGRKDLNPSTKTQQINPQEKREAMKPQPTKINSLNQNNEQMTLLFDDSNERWMFELFVMLSRNVKVDRES